MTDWNILPEELWVEIFNRVETVERELVSLVCKDWKRLIENPNCQPDNLSLIDLTHPSCLRLLRPPRRDCLRCLLLSGARSNEISDLGHAILSLASSLGVQRLIVQGILGPWIGYLFLYSQLKELKICITEQHLKDLALQPQVMSKLEVLELTCNFLSEQNTFNLALVLSSLSAVRALALQNVSVFALRTIFEQAERLGQLRHLVIMNAGAVEFEIGSSFQPLRTLTALHIRPWSHLQHMLSAIPNVTRLGFPTWYNREGEVRDIEELALDGFQILKKLPLLKILAVPENCLELMRTEVTKLGLQSDPVVVHIEHKCPFNGYGSSIPDNVTVSGDQWSEWRYHQRSK